MYLEFYFEVVRRTFQLVAAWQSVGFCHGVKHVVQKQQMVHFLKISDLGCLYRRCLRA